jgi:hypothetical protein
MIDEGYRIHHHPQRDEDALHDDKSPGTNHPRDGIRCGFSGGLLFLE